VLFLFFFNQNLDAQCSGIICPDDLSVEIDTPCDETNSDIETVTGFPNDPAGSAFFDEVTYLSAPGSNGVDGSCLGDEEYEYIDASLDISIDCVGDGYYASFDRTWSVYTAGGTFIDDCFQIIFLIDIAEPVDQIDLVSFFEGQDPMGNNWDNLILECPDAVFWDEPNLGLDVTDNCSSGVGIAMTSNIQPGDQLSDGLNIIEYEFTDGCGNVLSIEWDINVICIAPCMGAPLFEDCNDPPVECDLDVINGFMSCTPEYNGGTFGPMCNGEGNIENASYFSFVAGSSDITITIGVSDCINGIGIQANVVDPCTPNNCYGDNGAACFLSQFTFEATGLTIGNVYQLVVDGCSGDECAYTITIDSAPPFELIDPDDPIVESSISGCDIDANNIEICPGTELTFYPDNYADAEFFLCWAIDNNNGVVVLNNDTNCNIAATGSTFTCSADYSTCGDLQLEFNQAGTYELCLVEIDNGCDNLSPNNYCYTITVQDVPDVDWGVYDVCEVDVSFFTPPPHPVTGEQWIGPTGSNLVQGFNVFEIEDDCECEYSQLLTLNILPAEPTIDYEYDVCSYEFEDFVDPIHGLSYDDLLPFQIPNTNNFELVFIDGGSSQIDWEGNTCDVFANYSFDVYDISGSILQTEGSACNNNLSFEIDDSSFPTFMNEADISYSWFLDNNIIGLSPVLSINSPGQYSLILTYVMASGETCSFTVDAIDISLTGGAPVAPTFTQNPASTCLDNLSDIVYAVVPSSSSFFSWSVINGIITSGEGTNQISIDIVDPTLPTEISVFSSTPGCGDSPVATQTLLVLPNPVIALNNSLVADVDETVTIESTILSGNPVQYNWFVPASNASFPIPNNTLSSLPISWDAPGTYIVELTIVDSNGCVSNTAQTTITVGSEMDCQLQDENDTNFGLDRLNWNNGNTSIHSEGAAMNFDLTIDTFGVCSKITEVTIDVNINNIDTSMLGDTCEVPQYFLNIYIDDVLPFEPASIDANVLVGQFQETEYQNLSGSYTFTCENIDIPFDGQVGVDIIPVSNVGICDDSQELLSNNLIILDYDVCLREVVEENQPATIIIDSENTSFCIDDSLELSEIGANNVLWNWSGPNGFTSNNQSITQDLTDPADFGVYSVSVTDNQGCTGSRSITISQLPTPDVNVTALEVELCVGQDIVLAENGGDATMWNWFGPNGYIHNLQNITVETSSADDFGTYTVNIIDANGCTNTATIEIMELKLEIDVTAQQTEVCIGQDIFLEENGGVGENWAWEGPNGFSSTEEDPIIINSTSSNFGIYTVTVSDSEACSNVASVTIIESVAPSMNVSAAETNVCFGDDIVLVENEGAAVTWNWIGPNSFSSMNQSPIIFDISPDNVGNYSVTITDLNGCTNSDTIFIAGIENPTACFEGSGNLCENTCSDVIITFDITPANSNLYVELEFLGTSIPNYLLVGVTNGESIGVCSDASATSVSFDGTNLILPTQDLPNNTAIEIGIVSVYDPYVPTCLGQLGASCFIGLNFFLSNPVNVDPPVFVENPSSVCGDELADLVIAVEPIASSTFNWTIVNGEVTSGQGTEQITLAIDDPSMPIEIAVFSSDLNCGSSQAATHTLEVLASPVVELVNVLEAKIDETIVIESNVLLGEAAEYVWTVPASNATYPIANSTLEDLPISWDAEGMYLVELSIIDANGCISSIVQTIIDVMIVSIEDVYDTSQYQIFPNPFSNQFEIQGIEKEVKIEIYDTSGKWLESQKISKTNSSIGMEKYANGIYFIRINDGKQVDVLQKLVKI